MSDNDAPPRSGIRRAIPDDPVAKGVMAVMTTLAGLAIVAVAGLFLKVTRIETKMESSPSSETVSLLKSELEHLRNDRQRDNAQDESIAALKQDAKERSSLWWCRYSWTRDSIFDLQIAAGVPRTKPPNRCDE